MPKWKFRLAADIMLEIQPKLTRKGRLFHWSALRCEGASEKLLALPHKDLDRPYVAQSGTLVDEHRDGLGRLIDSRPGSGYTLRGRHVSWPHGLDRAAGLAAGRALRDAIDAAFREGRFDRFTPDMLGGHCLICGKALTDPVSMARFIGPECFGSSSVRIPRLLDVSATPPGNVDDTNTPSTDANARETEAGGSG